MSKFFGTLTTAQTVNSPIFIEGGVFTLKTKIYLDYNIFVNYLKGIETYNNLDDFKNHYSFFYGPPYLEEVVNINLTHKQKEIDRYITGMNKLFEKMCFYQS